MRELTWAPGSMAVIDYLLRPGGPAISAEAKCVYAALFSHMGDDGTCWPSLSRLSAGTGCARRTVQRRLDELQMAGLIGAAEQPGKVTRYTLHPPWDPCHTDTRAIQTPVSEGHPCQPDTPPVPEGHPTRVSVTPEVTHLRNPPKEPKDPPAVVSAPEREAAELWARVVAESGKQATKATTAAMHSCLPLRIAGNFLEVETPPSFEDRERLGRWYQVLQRILCDLGSDATLDFIAPQHEARGP